MTDLPDPRKQVSLGGGGGLYREMELAGKTAAVTANVHSALLRAAYTATTSESHFILMTTLRWGSRCVHFIEEKMDASERFSNLPKVTQTSNGGFRSHALSHCAPQPPPACRAHSSSPRLLHAVPQPREPDRTWGATQAPAPRTSKLCGPNKTVFPPGASVSPSERGTRSTRP